MSSNPALSQASAAAYLFDEYGGALSSELLLLSHSTNFHTLLRLGVESRAHVSAADRASIEVALACLAGSPSATVLSIAAEPAAYHWVSIARMCIKEASGAGRDPVLDDYEREFALDARAFRRRHLNDLRRFGLAAAVLNARLGRAEDWPDLEDPFSWVLPGTGVILVPPPGERRLPVLSAEALSRLAARDSDIRVEGSARIWRIERQPGGEDHLPFVLDTQDACMRLSFIESYARVDRDDELQRFGQVLTSALEDVRAYDAALAGEIGTVIRRVCPMHTAPRAFMSSGSVSSMFGAVFISYLEEPAFAAEMLLHEFGHNKLRLLDDTYGLLEPDDRCAYYSPWRNEPRPLDGIMHGLYVFSLVARYWLWVFGTADDGERRLLAERRVRTLVPQLELALAEFENRSRRTASGEAFLGAVRGVIASLRGQLPSTYTPGARQFLVGPVEKDLVDLTPEDAVSRHRAMFQERFGRAACA